MRQEHYNKQAWALAGRLAESQRETDPSGKLEISHTYLLSFEPMVAKYRKAVNLGLTLATKVLEKRLRDTGYYLEEAYRFWLQWRDTPPKPRRITFLQIYRELQQATMYGGWAFKSPNILHWTTPPIVLSDEANEGPYDVEFGEFDIQVDFTNHLLHRGPPLVQAIALHPHARGVILGYSHPNIKMHGEICLGAGFTAVSRALEDYRLLDVYDLVWGVLSYYDGADPFAALRLYVGGTCKGCSNPLAFNTFTCEICRKPLCEHCRVSCNWCGRYICSSHTTNCSQCSVEGCVKCLWGCKHSDCEEATCGTCLRRCRRCDTLRCGKHLKRGQHCKECLCEQNTDLNTQEGETPPSNQDTYPFEQLCESSGEVNPHRVRQTEVSPGLRRDRSGRFCSM